MSDRPTHRQVAEHMLTAYGRIEAYDAVYRLTDADGRPHRNTRLAATIWQLREDGWDIETVVEPGRLATYIYHGRHAVTEPIRRVEADVNTDVAYEHPVGDHRHDPLAHAAKNVTPEEELLREVHAEPVYHCTKCGAVAYEVEKSFDTKFGMGRCLSDTCRKLGKVPVKQR